MPDPGSHSFHKNFIVPEKGASAEVQTPNFDALFDGLAGHELSDGTKLAERHDH